MDQINIKQLNEIDGLLSEAEYSLKKKIFSLPKMEALVFSDPKLSAIYDEMAENGESKYGYHYNETIQNMIFNDYVLNSPKYLQKYKMAIPKKKKRRDKSGINQLKKVGAKKMGDAKGHDGGISETTSAGGAGSFNANSSTTGQYSTPHAWGDGDLMKGGKSKIMRKPIWSGGSIIQESSNYLVDPEGFKKYVNMINEYYDLNTAINIAKEISSKEGVVQHVNAISDDEYDVSDWYDSTDTVYSFENGRQLNEESKSKSQQRLFGMAHAAQKGDIPIGKLGAEAKKIAKSVKPSDVKDFASTKHDDLPEKVDEDSTSMVKASKMQSNDDSMSNKMDTSIPVGTQQTGGINESNFADAHTSTLKKFNEELEIFEKYHSKLVSVNEERKLSTEVDRQRIVNQNPSNFKNDLKSSGTNKTIDIEKELMWKNQQTEIKDPKKYTSDIEKNVIKSTDAKGDQHLKNVGDSANSNGDEIPKRNRTEDEQNEVDLYTKGLHSVNFDTEPNEKFVDRMKSDMGDHFYNKREKQLDNLQKQPLYNKESVPTYKGDSMNQFNKFKSVNESMITGRYSDALNKKCIIDFKLSEVVLSENVEGLFKLDFTGLGNTYKSRTDDGKVVVNESVISAINTYSFYTDGSSIYAISDKNETINENLNVDKKNRNDNLDKMIDLFKYNPKSFVNTNNVKKNRGF